MNIKESIDAERWEPGDHGLAPMPSVDHNASLDRIQAAVDKLIYSAVVTIELQDQRIAELEAALLDAFYAMQAGDMAKDSTWSLFMRLQQSRGEA